MWINSLVSVEHQKDAYKRKLVPFSASRCIYIYNTINMLQKPVQLLTNLDVHTEKAENMNE